MDVLYSWGVLTLYESPPMHCTDHLQTTVTTEENIMAVVERSEYIETYIEDKAELDVLLGPPG